MPEIIDVEQGRPLSERLHFMARRVKSFYDACGSANALDAVTLATLSESAAERLIDLESMEARLKAYVNELIAGSYCEMYEANVRADLIAVVTGRVLSDGK